MAWTWEVHEFSDGHTTLTDTTEEIVYGAYEKYYVYEFLISSSQDLTFSFENWEMSSPIGYVIQRGNGQTLNDFLSNTNGVPRNYTASFRYGQSATFDAFDDYVYDIVVRAPSSGSFSRATCRVEFSEPHVDTRYFTAQVASVWNSIYVAVSNYDTSYRNFRFELTPSSDPENTIVYPTSGTTYQDNYTFTDLAEGTYTVRVTQDIGTHREWVRTANGDPYIEITIANLWTRYPSSPDDNLGRITAIRTLDIGGVYNRTLYRYRMNFPSTGNVVFSSAGNLDLVAWLSDSTQSLDFDRTIGEPNEYLVMDDSGAGDGKNFKITRRCRSDRAYYLWFKYKEGTSSYEPIYITINPVDFTAWTYEPFSDQLELEEVVVPEVELDEHVGAHFTFSCAEGGTVRIQPYNTGATAYITDGNYGFDLVDGTPLDALGNKVTGSRDLRYSVTKMTVYHLWIKTTSSEGYGTCAVTITPPAFSYVWALNDQTDDTSVQDLSENVSRKSIEITRDIPTHTAYTIEFAVSFAYSGVARLFSSGIETSDILSLDAYLSTSDSSIDTSFGAPINYDMRSIGSPNFTLELTVTAGTVYYFWIKPSGPKQTGSALLGITVPGPAPFTSKGYWINSTAMPDGWNKLTVWINQDATPNGWVKLKPVLCGENLVWIIGT